MTSEELLNKYKDGTGRVRNLSGNTVEKLMIEFAQYHVEQALKASAIRAKLLSQSNWGSLETSKNDENANYELKDIYKTNNYGHGDCNYEIITVSKESILTSYPLTNIK